MKHNEQKTMQDMPLEELWPLIEEVFSAGGRFRLFPRGNSMLPLIRPNIDSVLIERPTEISRYDILLYRRQNGQFVLHRLMKIEKDTFTMCGDHQYYLEKGLPRDAVLARVCGIYFGDNYLPFDAPKLRRYARRRAFSRPFRHLIGGMARRFRS